MNIVDLQVQKINKYKMSIIHQILLQTTHEGLYMEHTESYQFFFIILHIFPWMF